MSRNSRVFTTVAGPVSDEDGIYMSRNSRVFTTCIQTTYINNSNTSSIPWRTSMSTSYINVSTIMN